MMRVVIADDEEKVCLLIQKLVDWTAMDMEIVGVAHNGLEALELIETRRPDLMITDIRMPGCDGIELIRRARQLDPALEFIIVSGYRHFEYAQSALKYGAGSGSSSTGAFWGNSSNSGPSPWDGTLSDGGGTYLGGDPNDTPVWPAGYLVELTAGGTSRQATLLPVEGGAE